MIMVHNQVKVMGGDDHEEGPGKGNLGGGGGKMNDHGA